MAKTTKKQTAGKSASDNDKPAKSGHKSNSLIDISLPGAETKKIPLKKQRT